jgi:drug/metabolite transporter (DMT)-like permease
MPRETAGWLLVALCLLATLAAQVLLRQGVVAAGGAGLLTALRQPVSWLALGCAGIAGGAWMAALARLPLSAAYPVMALSFPLVSAWAWLRLGEAVPPLRVLGLALIVAGALCVGASQLGSAAPTGAAR